MAVPSRCITVPVHAFSSGRRRVSPTLEFINSPRPPKQIATPTKVSIPNPTHNSTPPQNSLNAENGSRVKFSMQRSKRPLIDITAPDDDYKERAVHTSRSVRIEKDNMQHVEHIPPMTRSEPFSTSVSSGTHAEASDKMRWCNANPPPTSPNRKLSVNVPQSSTSPHASAAIAPHISHSLSRRREETPGVPCHLNATTDLNCPKHSIQRDNSVSELPEKFFVENMNNDDQPLIMATDNSSERCRIASHSVAEVVPEMEAKDTCEDELRAIFFPSLGRHKPKPQKETAHTPSNVVSHHKEHPSSDVSAASHFQNTTVVPNICEQRSGVESIKMGDGPKLDGKLIERENSFGLNKKPKKSLNALLGIY